MKKFFLIFIFSLFPIPSLAGFDAIPTEIVDSIVHIKIAEMERGIILKYTDEITGVLVSRDGKILTSYEKVKKIVDFPNRYKAVVCRNYGKIDSAGCGFEAQILGTDIYADIALLHINTIWETSEDNKTLGEVFKFYYDESAKEKYPFNNYVSSLKEFPEIGSPVYVLGYTKDGNSVMTILPALVNIQENREGILDTALPNGFSGGGVFTQNDKFIGMITANNPNNLGKFLNTKWINQFFIKRASHIDLAGSLEVPCGKNTKEREDKTCECKRGFIWRNQKAICEKIESHGYCGKNSFRLGDACECNEGFSWGSQKDSSEIMCLSPSEISDIKIEVRSWKKLLFTPIQGLKIFAKKLKNEKVLLLWKPVEGKKAKNCEFTFRDIDGTDGEIIFQKKNVALIKVESKKKYSVEIENCTVDDTEKLVGSSFFAQ